MRTRLFSPDYALQTTALDDKAGELVKAPENYEAYAKASATETRSEETLGLKNGD